MVPAIPEKKQNGNTEMDCKTDTILENQTRIMGMFSELGRILIACADGNAVAHSVPNTPQLVSSPADPYVSEYTSELEQAAARLNERQPFSCTQVRAAEILGVSVRTITRLLDTGNLRRIAHQVDMTPIVEYIRNTNDFRHKEPNPIRFEESAKNEPDRRGRKHM